MDYDMEKFRREQEEERRKEQKDLQERALPRIRTYKKPVHPDFAWWKEREQVREDIGSYGRNRYGNAFRSLNQGDLIAPPEDVLRTLDKFESLLAWLETKPVGQEMTAFEKAQVALKLLDATNTHSHTVSLETDSIDVNLKGDSDYPVRTMVDGGLRIDKD